MLSFMVLCLARSGSAWAANWLTDGRTLCLHEPLFSHHYTDLDRLRFDRPHGVACTGLPQFHEWVNAHPCPKVILHRPIKEVNASLKKIGLPRLTSDHEWSLEQIRGMHCDWRDLFNAPEPIYRHLIGDGFDQSRHKVLCDLNVQMAFEAKHVDKTVTRRIMTEMRQACE